MYYANSERMQAEIHRLAAEVEPPLRWFCIDISAVDDVDYTATSTLGDIKATLRKNSIELVFVQDVDDVNAKSRKQLGAHFADAAFFDSLDDVLNQYERQSPV